jgi:septal ring factor EnvC (AmiA/AmiB activator)
MTPPNHTDLYQGLGRLEGATQSMGARLDKIEDVLERIDQRLANLEGKENQRRGALAMLMVFSGAIGGLIAKFGTLLFGGPAT